jgi:hypothetical protein
MAITSKERVGRPFEKGVSGNPGGRPKERLQKERRVCALVDVTPLAARLRRKDPGDSQPGGSRRRPAAGVTDLGLGGVAALGAFYAVNPAMGWLFAVAIGLRARPC